MGRSRSSSRSRSRSRSQSRSRHHDRQRRSRSHSRSRSSSSEEEGYRIHVADLGIDCSKREMENAFKKFGPLLEVWLAHNPPCFAFVVYQYSEDAEEAIQEMNGKQICGSRVKVSHARPRTRGLQRKRGFDPNLRCYQCGERGHFSRDCDQVWKARKQEPPGSRAGPLRFNLSEKWEISDDDVIKFNRTPSKSRSRSRSRSRSKSSRHKKSKHKKRSRSKDRSRHKKRSHKESKKERHGSQSSKDGSRSVTDEPSSTTPKDSTEKTMPESDADRLGMVAVPDTTVVEVGLPPSSTVATSVNPASTTNSSSQDSLRWPHALATETVASTPVEDAKKETAGDLSVSQSLDSQKAPAMGKFVPMTTAVLNSEPARIVSPSPVRLTIASSKMPMIPRVVTVSANSRLQ